MKTTVLHICLRAFLAVWLACCGAAALAQTYAYRNDVFSYDTPSTAAKTVTWHTSNTTACSDFPYGDDDYADITFAGATSPANNFTFTFAGVARTGVRIYSNGMLAFGNDTSGLWRDYTNGPLPIGAQAAYSASCSGGVPANTLVAYWTDIVAGTANSTANASVKYELLGTAPNRRFVISWVNVKLYGQTERYNFQVILYESPAGGLNSNFKYQYTTGSSTGQYATVGVQVSATDYTQYSYDQAFIDPIAGSAILWYPANQLQGKQAEYRFDEGVWNGTANEVKDTSTGAYNAASVGGATNISNGKVCRGGNFPANSGTVLTSAVSSLVAPASAGSIDFWYNANTKWGAGNSSAMLFDATASAAKPFFLMRSASGALTFSVTDSAGTVLSLSSSNQSFAAGTWHHVGASWNLRPGTNQTVLQIFLDGVLVKSLRTTSNGSITALNNLYIGDAWSSSVTPNGGTNNSANGYLDEVNLYNVEINASQAAADMNASRSNCLAFDHFHIIHDGSVVTCDTAKITIEAHDSAHGLITLAGTTANLSTSTNRGNWTTVASINPVVNAGNGVGSYTFSNESKVTVGLQYGYAEKTNINVVAGIYSEHSGAAANCTASDNTYGGTCDADLAFTGAGLRFVDANGAALGNQVAGVSSPSYYLQALKSNCTSPSDCTCTSLFSPTTPVDVDLAFECVNPAKCQSGQLTFTPGVGAIAGNAGGVSPSTGSYTSKSLTFNATALPGAVPFTFAYSDVGQIRLWARYPAGASTPTASGQSAAVVVAPHHFSIGNVPAAPLVAGKPFAVTVTAQNASGAQTPNFGQENNPESVAITATQCQPSGTSANTGSLSGATVGSFSTGTASVTGLAWSEVGNIDLTATLSNAKGYLDSGLTATGNTGFDSTGSGAVGMVCSTVTSTGKAGNVGRFVPDHFTTTVKPGCATGAFTYSGQPFELTIQAWNGAATPALTKNYDGATATLSPHFANDAALTVFDSSAATMNPGPGALNMINVAASSFTLGSAKVTPTYTFSSPKTVKTTIRLRAAGPDNVTSAASSEDKTYIYSGRFWLTNAYGTEFLALPVPMQVQYWTPSGWAQNRDDNNCTTLAQPTSANGGLTNTLKEKTTASISSVVNGSPAFKLSAPGAAGLVDIVSSVLLGGQSWLSPSVPSVRACFGACGPRSPVIYSRERF